MKHILITGAPGVGKTTLVKKIVDALNLSERAEDYDGFYTEEVRENKRRTGFDVVTLDGQRAVLARKGSNEPTANMPTVGQYEVHLEDFEKVALPALETNKSLLIIDEIGKMEMFSEKFQEAVKKIIRTKDMCVIATVPLKGGSGLVKQLKESKDCVLITVDETNRDSLAYQIVNTINKK